MDVPELQLFVCNSIPFQAEPRGFVWFFLKKTLFHPVQWFFPSLKILHTEMAIDWGQTTAIQSGWQNDLETESVQTRLNTELRRLNFN